MRILITGAAGDIGSNLLKLVNKKGFKTRALVRNPNEAKKIVGLCDEIIIGDITNKESIKSIAKNVDVCFHLAATLFVSNPVEELRKVNYEGTINIANECIKNSVKRFIFPSVPQVLGPHRSPKPPINAEEALINPTSYHALYKKLCEQHLMVLHKHSKLNVTILRLGTVYGPNIRFIKTLKSFLLRGYYRIPGDGSNMMSFAHIKDVVQAFLLALQNNFSIGKIYNVADLKPVEFKEFIFAFSDLLKVPRPGFAPIWQYRLLAKTANTLSRITRKPPLLNSDIINFSISSFAADISKTSQELGFKPIYPTISEGLLTCVQEFETEKEFEAA